MTRTGSPSRRTLLGSALASGAVVTTGLQLSGSASAATERPGDQQAAADGDDQPATDQPATASAQPRSGSRVLTGAEVAAANDWAVLRGTRLGIFSNPTGILPDARHIVDDLAEHDDLTIVGAFGPEHGFRGSAQAGGSEGDSRDPRTGIPVYDAYGANQTKLGQLFTKAGVETLVFDIQDVGARFYTYIWTMYNSMAAAARLGIRYVVLDRPNPIGGRVDGAMMTPDYTSGVGAKEIVQQHGLTVGELARFFNGELLPAEAGRPVDLEVVEVRGWRPDSRAQEYDPVWPPPSPNVPTPDTALAYVGTCFFEGTNLSEGRGTTRPFELVGAPYLDYHWGDRLNSHGLAGVEFREAYFVPTFNKYVGETCAGVQVHVTDVRAFQPIPAAVAMLVEARRYADFQWRYDTYDANRPYWIDKLSGSPRLRTMIDAGATVTEVVGAWSEEVKEFDARRRQYLLYPGRRA
ncbi:exo-beta-N-acetylmuramidase NamZ family protein [Actinopolymorpha singaporensis]|uniref:Uncharacterized conserved protein YbbC, DUF1343 family n=1 Tax=Actinopolymorpha singaporensis TaxID=117157 RepID=A0A1H1T0G2_9ACTN|nr:DUF1343 domain-containing protein [Actinopolymorpha singaporensis]SDS53139.1 Uncharacterized conserved protein YbbC, DUF1343 family [Actinopolymorpha singaporensis]